ncbi:MAG: hypothetical protein AAF418_03125 [Pseudomonadota bacterium]
MFSFAKLLLLGALILLVWYGAKALSASRKQVRDQADQSGDSAVETKPCRLCGLFQGKGREQSCERPDCPWST